MEGVMKKSDEARKYVTEAIRSRQAKEKLEQDAKKEAHAKLVSQVAADKDGVVKKLLRETLAKIERAAKQGQQGIFIDVEGMAMLDSYEAMQDYRCDSKTVQDTLIAERLIELLRRKGFKAKKHSYKVTRGMFDAYWDDYYAGVSVSW